MRKTTKQTIGAKVAIGAFSSALVVGGTWAQAPANLARSAAPADPAAAELAYYPQAARAAGLEGSATIACASDIHFALSQCRIVSESPTGQGFGEAAVAIAERGGGNPYETTSPSASTNVSFYFRLHPPSISPNLLGPFQPPPKVAPAPIHWATLPTVTQMAAVYPKAARRAGQSGVADLSCEIRADGELSHCTVAAEAPTDAGFGAAALSLARFLRAVPPQGPAPPGGFRTIVPVRFRPPQ
ncbi:MAG: TonB family protein [Caulobacteraceae bacterium]